MQPGSVGMQRATDEEQQHKTRNQLEDGKKDRAEICKAAFAEAAEQMDHTRKDQNHRQTG